jgi:hypothetical protein
MDYENFELQIGPWSHDGLLVRVWCPAGEGEVWVRLLRFASGPEPLAEIGRYLAGETWRLPGSPAEIGSDIFRSVFTGPVAALFQKSLSRVEVPARGLRVRIRINPRDRTLASLHALPWELLYQEDTEDFLALSRGTPIVRALDVPRPAALRPYQPPLRILAILARDPESSPLSLEEELGQLQKALEGNPEIQLEILEDPDTRTIRNALDQGGFHILHYMGHGVFEPASGEGALLFGSPEGRLPVTGRHLATKVKDLDALRLVVLNACETAIVGGEAAQGPFAGVATALVLGGVPAVVAMQSSIRDAHSVAFTSAFYRRLAGGMPVEEAVTEGRQAIHSLEPDAASWAIPVLFLRSAGDLFAWGRGKEPEPAAEISPPPARQGFRSLTARPLLLWLLAVVLGAGVVSQVGGGFAGLLTDADPGPPLVQLEKQPTVPNQIESPAPAVGASTADRWSQGTPLTPPKDWEGPAPARWVRLELAIPAGLQHGTVLVDGSPARVLDRLPNFIDIQVPDANRPVAVRVESRGRVCEQTVLPSPLSSPLNICSEGH